MRRAAFDIDLFIIALASLLLVAFVSWRVNMPPSKKTSHDPTVLQAEPDGENER